MSALRGPARLRHRLYDDTKSIAGRHHHPGYKVDSWWTVGIFTASGFVDQDKPIATTQEGTRRLPLQEPTKVKVNGVNLTYEGWSKVRSRSCQGPTACSHTSIRVRGPGGHLHRLPRLRWHLQRRCPLVAHRRDHIADACSMQVGDLASGSVASMSRRWRAADDPRGDSRLIRGIRLGYLSLDRPSGTLWRVAAQDDPPPRLLVDHITFFDEPTIGLHPHDIQRMNDLCSDCATRATRCVVEHKPGNRIADHIVDLGPGAGTAGGEVVFEGTVDELRSSGTITGRHLDDRASVKKSCAHPPAFGGSRGQHNLQDVDVDIRSASWWWSQAWRVGQSSLMHGSVSGRDDVVSGRPDDRGSRRSNPATTPDCSTRSARRSPGQRREAGAVQRQLEGACYCSAGLIYTELGFMDTIATTCEVRASGTRRRCWNTSSEAATSARCSPCR
jgi:hypothetical protein